MSTTRLLSLNLLLMLLGATTSAQSVDKPQETNARGVIVTASAATTRVRFTAPGTIVQMRLEVLSDAGHTLADLSTKGNVLDWTLVDSAGARPIDGAYLCVVTVKSLSGRLSQRIGSISIEGERVSLRPLEAGKLTVAQRQAVGPVEENAALTLLQEGETAAATIATHDGTNGQVTSTTGALTFRTGDFFSGKDVERMRLTEAGNLGIGTDEPEVRLDVNGMIRARSGFQFADGSVLNLAPTGGGLRVTLPSGEVARVHLAPNAPSTQNRLAKFIDGGSTVGDSALAEGANGFIGWGTATPQHPFVVRRNGASLGVHSIGELFVDRDDRTRSASLTVGTAGTLKWIFGMPFNSDGFQVFDLTNNVSRFFIDPTNGNIGMGTTAPTSKLEIAAQDGLKINGFQPFLTLRDANTGRSSFVQGVNGDLVFIPQSFAGSAAALVIKDFSGNIGIGTSNPQSKLQINGAGQFNAPEAARFDLFNTTANFGYFQHVLNDKRWQLATSSGATMMVVKDNGSVGIGSVDPQAKLQIAGTGTNGFTLGVEGNVTQNRDKGGFVKAMVYVNGDGRIFRCYNGITGSSSGNCGFTVSRGGFPSGSYLLDFGFPIDDRFYSLSVQGSCCFSPPVHPTPGIYFSRDNVANGNQLQVYVFETEAEVFTDRPFMVIVY